MGQGINQYDVFWVSLDPTKGSEISKKRPCIIVSPDELNKHLRTVIIAPLTSTIKSYPWRVDCLVLDNKGSIALDQIRTIDKNRIGNVIGHLKQSEIENIKSVLMEMLC
jgi:mRNA interferase MazF